MRLTKEIRAVAVGAVVAAAVVASPRDAKAEQVPPTAKGITGCALLGAEVVVFGEAIFGVRSTAAYLIGAGAGAVAGGVGGYFLEQGVSDGRVPAYLLAGGLALIIPALVVAFDQTRYMPTEGAREDRPVNVPPAEPGKPGGSSVVGPGSAPAPAPEPAPAPTTPPPSSTEPPAAPAPAPAPPPGGAPPTPPTKAPQSLFDIDHGLRLGMPLPQVRPVFSTAEQKKYSLQSSGGTEVRFPVVSVTF
jgi:hypothetical protein